MYDLWNIEVKGLVYGRFWRCLKKIRESYGTKLLAAHDRLEADFELQLEALTSEVMGLDAMED